MKMPVKDPSKKTSSRKAPDPNRCVFETSDGRRCHLARSATHASLCVFHSQEEQQLLESRKLGGELASSLTSSPPPTSTMSSAMFSLPSRKTACPRAPPTPWPTLASSCSSLFPPSNKSLLSITNSSSGPTCWIAPFAFRLLRPNPKLLAQPMWRPNPQTLAKLRLNPNPSPK